jgi:ABC-type microcin C transport system duplicated ATPase subunit YejF
MRDDKVSNAMTDNEMPQVPLLQVEKLEVTFATARGPAPVLKGISFELSRGETLALVGESGSGKSMTALSILKLLPKNAEVRGAIRFDGEDLVALPADKMRKLRGSRIGIVFQEPMSSLNPLFSIGHQVEEAILFHNHVSRSQARERALELLRLVKLPEPERRFHNYPHELSGGQLQRVMIAIALANDPDMLIADEPTTALDVTIQAQILSLLKELQQRLSLALLLITHDFGVVRKMADRVCVMRLGEIVEAGPAEEIFQRPRETYTQELLAAEPERRKNTGTPQGDVVIDARNVTVDFGLRTKLFQAKQHFRAVDGISLQVRKGQTVGIVGESGSGKSTLGRALLGLVKSNGEIYYEGRDIGGLKPDSMRALRQRLQIVFQDPFGSLSPRLKVAEIIGEGLQIHRADIGRKERDVLIAEVLRDVGINPDTRFRFPHEFSGGQRQRIAIARAMVLRPNVIVLDEPTSALDRSVQLQILRLLEDLQEKYGLTYIFISHDLSVIRAISDEVIVMKNGRVVESGSAEKVFSAPENSYTQDLMKASFEIVAR